MPVQLQPGPKLSELLGLRLLRAFQSLGSDFERLQVVEHVEALIIEPKRKLDLSSVWWKGTPSETNKMATRARPSSLRDDRNQPASAGRVGNFKHAVCARRPV